MNHDKLNKIFDIGDDREVEGVVIPQRVTLTRGRKDANRDNEEDVQLAKDNIRGMIEASSHALEELVNISIQSQSSKHFDSLANLIKALNESNKHLFDMATISSEVPAAQTNIQNNTAVFVGSTTEFLKAIKEAS